MDRSPKGSQFPGPPQRTASMIVLGPSFPLRDLALRLEGAPHAGALLDAAREDLEGGYLPVAEVWRWWVRAVGEYRRSPTERGAAAVLDGSIPISSG